MSHTVKRQWLDDWISRTNVGVWMIKSSYGLLMQDFVFYFPLANWCWETHRLGWLSCQEDDERLIVWDNDKSVEGWFQTLESLV